MPEGAVYVGRPTKWGNPCATAAEYWAVAAHHIASGGDFEDLRGKDLACWCSPDADCHADILLELANLEGPFT